MIMVKLCGWNDVLPKLPSHIQTHCENWDRNHHIKESVARVASKNEMLHELNKKVLLTLKGKNIGDPKNSQLNPQTG